MIHLCTSKNEAEKQHGLQEKLLEKRRLHQAQERKRQRSFHRECARRRAQARHEAEKAAAAERQYLAEIEWAWMRAQIGLILYK